MLLGAAADRERADQQHALAAFERLGERLGLVEVAAPDGRAPLGEVLQGRDVASIPIN